MNALIKLYIANLKEFSRDRVAMFWIIGFPIFFVGLLGMIFGSSGEISYRIGIANLDQGKASTSLVNVFQAVASFEITVGEQENLAQRLKEGDYQAVIVIPTEFTANMQSGLAVDIEVIYDDVEIIYDPSSQTTAQIVMSIVRNVVNDFEHQFTQNPQLIFLSEKSITSNSLSSMDFLLPGILGMSLMQLGIFGTAPQLVQLRELQVLRRIGATPLPRSILLGSQVLVRLTTVGIQIFLIILVGVIVYDVSIEGNILHVIGVSLLGALMFIAMGYMISGIANTQESVHGITSFLNFPMLFLSGLFFPVEMLPVWIQPVASVIPLTYLVDALRQIIVGASPQYNLGLDITVLVAWLVGCSLLSIRLFRWE
jgi:ABC-2 type transport system permease protein